MTEETKQPETAPVLKPATKVNPAQTTEKSATGQETIKPPVEYISDNGAVMIAVDGDQVDMLIDPLVAEEIGCYRRCKKIRVTFANGQGVKVVPIGL